MPSVKRKNGWFRPRWGWKVVQSKAKTRKRTMLAVGVLALVAGLIFISWIIRFTGSLFSPWKTSSYHKNYLWNNEFNLNLVIKSKNISLFSYNPKNMSITIINIPDETFLEVPYGYGKWQLQAIYDFGQSQKEIGGDKLLVDTLITLFGIPIDGFVKFNTTEQKSATEIVNILRKTPFSGLNFSVGLKTNLTMWELLQIKLAITQVRFDKIKELDLKNLMVLDKENLSDGTPVLTADPVKLDSIITDLVDPAIVAERKSIAVLNATDHPQLALKWARLITNSGGNVIITANAQRKLDHTQIVGQDCQTLKRLRQIFQLDCQDSLKCGKVPLTDDLVYERVQINVLLGEDFVNK